MSTFVRVYTRLIFNVRYLKLENDNLEKKIIGANKFDQFEERKKKNRAIIRQTQKNYQVIIEKKPNHIETKINI
jgi:hypothetical protein